MITSNNNYNKYNGLQIDNINYIPRENNNCYTYAINQPINPYTKEKYIDYGYCQPGCLGGKEKEGASEYYNRNFQNFIELVKKDLQDIGFEIIETNYEEYIENENCWKVGYCYGGGDYHWYRQNIDGTWSHKPGQNEVKNKDEDGNIIYNPKECNRGKYEYFVGFYIIRKIIEECLIVA